MESKSTKEIYVSLNYKQKLKLQIEKTTIQSKSGSNKCIMYDIYAKTGYHKSANSFLDGSDVIGFAMLAINPMEHMAVLRNIKVTDSERLGQGIGSAMLKAVEDLCISNGCTRIEGLFRPDTNHRIKREDVEKFYKKNGYFLYFDDESDYGWTIAKNLSPNPTNQDDESTM